MKMLYRLFLIVVITTISTTVTCTAQTLLQKRITLNAVQKPLLTVMQSMEVQGGFTFSYNSSLIKADSLVTIRIKDKTVSDALLSLFGGRFEFKERNNHIIILPKNEAPSAGINGMVVDRETGESIPYATVYSREQLVAAMTDENGTFNLPLKKRTGNDSISVSRVSYADTTLLLPSSQTVNLQIKLSSKDQALDSVFISMMKNRDWLSRTFISYKQAVNSLNLGNFIVDQPVQFSILPGMGSRGKISSQVVNNFSFNVLGGYNGGVDGVEIGGLYNVINKDARYVQVAGLFNVVGGHSEGVQVAGLYNKAATTNGVQVGGLYNQVQTAKGMQVAGLYNNTVHANGLQVAGLYNKTKTMKGMQVSGLFNQNDSAQGFQIAGLLNKNKHFSGLQIAPVNISDTMNGVSIGLVSIVKGGYHKISFSVNETGANMIAFKSGNPQLYNIITGGAQFDQNKKLYAFGYGLGSDLSIRKSPVYFNPELYSIYFYNGNWQQSNISWKLQTNVKYKITKWFAIYGGPSFTMLYSKPGVIPSNYQDDISNGAHKIKISNRLAGWVGWNVGIDLL